MRLFRSAICLAFMATAMVGSNASAQCQNGRGGGNTGAQTASTPYTQSALANGYNQNTLNPTSYNQQALAPLLAMEQYSRNQRALAAMQVQAQSLALQSQIAQAQNMSKQMAKASAEKRKAAQKERAENLALREEREAAKRAKNYESQRSTTRLASLQ